MAEATNNSGLLTVRLVTPDRVLLDATAEAVGEQTFFVAWGFVEVLPERVTILAETALHPNEINVSAAEAELKHAEELWTQAGDDGEKYDEANAITRMAEEKLASAQGHH
jgi:F-type H+-transporting ATPase subunit epsilon